MILDENSRIFCFGRWKTEYTIDKYYHVEVWLSKDVFGIITKLLGGRHVTQYF